MKNIFLSIQKRTISLFCAFVLLAALFVAVLPCLSFPASAAEVVSTGSCGDSLTYTLTDDGVLTISGTGAMTDFSSSSAAPWADYKTSITSVVIESGVTSIGSWAFAGCSAIVSVDIPDTIQKLGAYSFYGCAALLSVNIPSGVVEIPASCFSGCSSLTSVSLPNTLQTIGDSAFHNCALTSIELPESLVSIGAYAFAFTDFFSFTIPANVSSIGNYLFKECYNLSEIIFLSSTPPTYNSSYALIDSYTPVEVLWVPVGALETYKTSSSFSKYSSMFAEIGSDLIRNCVNMQDFYVSSSQTDDALIELYEVANDGFYKSSLSYVVTYLEDVTSAYKNTGLPWFQQSFYIADIADDAYDYTLSCSFTYTTTAASSYSSDGYEFTVFFYDADGNFITSHYSGKTSCKLPAGTQTLTKTYTGVFPEGAVYMGIYYYIGAFKSTAMPTNMSVNMTLSVSSEPIVPPVEPTIGVNLSPTYSYTIGDTPSQMTITASVTDEGTLSYQWYENTANSTTGGTAISGATSASYTPVINELGTKYYYCAVTNTLGELSTTVYSDVATVIVSEPGAPVITTDLPSSVSYAQGDTASPLSIQATLTSSGTLSYQWYGGVSGLGWPQLIEGATSSSYTPSTTHAGSFVYYCVVTNTASGYASTVSTIQCAVNVGTSSTFNQHSFRILNYKNYITEFGGAGSYDILTVQFPFTSLYTAVQYSDAVQTELVGSAWLVGYGSSTMPEDEDYYTIFFYPMGRGKEMENVLSLDNLPNGTIADFSFGGTFYCDGAFDSVTLGFNWYDENYNSLSVTGVDADGAYNSTFTARYTLDAPDGAAYFSYFWIIDGFSPEEYMPTEFAVDSSSVVFTVAADIGASDEVIEDLKDQLGSLEEQQKETNEKLDEITDILNKDVNVDTGLSDFNSASDNLAQAGADANAAISSGLSSLGGILSSGAMSTSLASTGVLLTGLFGGEGMDIVIGDFSMNVFDFLLTTAGTIALVGLVLAYIFRKRGGGGK